MSMMWRSSKTGFGTPSRGGIVILRRSSGAARGMLVATGPMLVVIGRADQEPPPNMCCLDVFGRCAITGGSTMPSQMASDPLAGIDRGTRSGSQAKKLMSCAHAPVHDDDQPRCLSYPPGFLRDDPHLEPEHLCPNRNGLPC